MSDVDSSDEKSIELADWFFEQFSYRFSDPNLLLQALTHRSFPAPKIDEESVVDPAVWHNERLEFLGDAVLNLAISEILYLRFPEAPEGELSHFRSTLVNTRSLGSFGKQWQFGKYLRLGRGEDMSGGREKVSILSDCVEAILGAVHLDGGFAEASLVIKKIFLPQIEMLKSGQLGKDYKSMLQECLQAEGRTLPNYKVEDVSGAPHERTFTVSCKVDGEMDVGVGKGRSKRNAEQNAAHAMLAELTLLDTE
ncbi:MAG: ribonuclease III [Magnetococcales bacterium]|nr:ribonuclease III [Magnetococcales bacterium]